MKRARPPIGGELNFLQCESRPNPVGIRGGPFRVRNSKSGFAPWHGALRWRAAQVRMDFFCRVQRCDAERQLLGYWSLLPVQRTSQPQALAGQFKSTLAGSQQSRPRPVAGVTLYNQGLLQAFKSYTISVDRAPTIWCDGRRRQAERAKFFADCVSPCPPPTFRTSVVGYIRRRR